MSYLTPSLGLFSLFICKMGIKKDRLHGSSRKLRVNTGNILWKGPGTHHSSAVTSIQGTGCDDSSSALGPRLEVSSPLAGELSLSVLCLCCGSWCLAHGTPSSTELSLRALAGSVGVPRCPLWMSPLQTEPVTRATCLDSTPQERKRPWRRLGVTRGLQAAGSGRSQTHLAGVGSTSSARWDLRLLGLPGLRATSP